MNSLIHQAIAPSTKRVYTSGVRRFKQFCAREGLTHLPATELTLRLFCTQESHRVSGSTIAVYVAAVRMDHLTSGYPDPTTNAPLLALLLKGIKRTHTARNSLRQPITVPILKIVKLSLRRLFHTYDRHLYWAVFTMAFYGFMRVGEYTRHPQAPAVPHARSQPARSLSRQTLSLYISNALRQASYARLLPSTSVPLSTAHVQWRQCASI